jgi:Sugar (and other) transporter
MFDQSTRSLGQASASANNWFWNFIVSRFTPQMFLKMSYGVYFFFASLMILSVPFVYFLIPETKSIPLESMDRLFDIRPVSRAHATVLREIREQEEEFRHDAEGAGLSAEKSGKATKIEDVEV